MRKFLQTQVANGGAIPKCSQLRDCYLLDVYQTERAALKELVANKQVALIVDKLSDSEGRFVLDVMAVFLDFDELPPGGNSVAWLLDSHFLPEINNTVSQAIVKTMHDYSIEFNNVHVFNSDSVSYMKKAFCDALSCLFPFCIHITCHSHIVNLVTSDFKKAFKEITEFVKCFCNLGQATRNSQKLNIPLCKSATGQRSFQYRVASIWNVISPILKLSQCVSSFKCNLKLDLLK